MSLGFDTALTALTAARTALATIGHNIANANTQGYSRQRVLLSQVLPQSIGRGLFVGAGVGIDSIDQIADPLIVGRLRAQSHEVGRAAGQTDVWRDLEAALGEPSDNGLNSLLAGFFGSLGSLETAPDDGPLRSAALQKGASLAQIFRTIRTDVSAMSDTIDQSIGFEVARVNKTLGDIYELNQAIVRNGFAGSTPADVLDRQNQLLAELSSSVDVRVTREPTGQISVTSAGQLLVNPNSVNEITVIPRQITGAGVQLRSGKSTVAFQPKSGRLSSLLDQAPGIADRGGKALDDLARSLIRSVNHAHATGVPAGGGYTSVKGLNAFQDSDLDGSVLDEKLGSAGLPFDVEDGFLTVSVQDPAGNLRQTRIGVLANQTTVSDLVNAFNAVGHLSASVDSTGRLHIDAETGYKFDFSARLNPAPDVLGTFSGAQPTIVAPLPFPVAIPPGLQFQIAVDGGAPQTVTFLASHFANPAAATPEEMAAAINAQVAGAHAFAASGRLVVQGNTVGSSGSLQLNGGPVVSGTDQPVKVVASGAFTGPKDESFTLVPTSDGIIGQTPGLQVNVTLPNGTVVATLDVGLGYTPETPIEMRDGIKVSFSAGPVSKHDNHFLTIEAIANGDQSDILVAAGINSFFSGTDAATIGVRQDLIDDPSLLAAGLGGGVSDGSNLGRLIAAGAERFAGLGNLTLAARLQVLIQDTGSNLQRSQSTLETQQLVMDQLEARRQSVSGVNIDEELLQMEAFQRSFEVAARFTQTLSDVNDVLMNLLG